MRSPVTSVAVFALLCTLAATCASASDLGLRSCGAPQSEAHTAVAILGSAPEGRAIVAASESRDGAQSVTRAAKEAEDGKVREQAFIVVANGVGASPKAALDNALEAAVSQVLGRLVHADTLVENDKVIYDKIVSATSGFVEKFEKLSEGSTDGLYSVRIKAEVRSDKLRAEVASKIEGARGVDGQSLRAKVDGQSLRAKIVTRASAAADARELVSTLLSRLPSDLLVVKLLCDPDPVEGVKLPEGLTRLRWPIEVCLDEGVWSSRSTAIMRALETVAVANRTASMRLTPRTLSAGDDLGFGGGGEGKHLVCRALDGADWTGAKPAAGLLLPSRISQASFLLRGDKTSQADAIAECWERYAALDRSVAERASARLNQPIESVFVVHGNLRSGALSVTTYAVPQAMVEHALDSFEGKFAINISVLDATGGEIAKDSHEFNLAPARSYWSDTASAKGGSGGFRSNSGSAPVSFLLAGRGLRGRLGERGEVSETMVVPGAFVERRFGSATIEFGVIHAWKGNVYLDLSTSQLEQVHEVRCVLEMR